MKGGFPATYTSQNPWTILGSSGQNRIRQTNMPIRIFWCSRIPTYSNVVIHCVRLKPLHKSRFFIPLCRLRCRPLVRPINEVDVSRWENEFVMGYHDGDCALYMSPYNNLDELIHVSDDIQASWSTFWQEANEEFDTMLQNDSDLAYLAGKMSYVWGGNHRLTAWWRDIQKHHSVDKDWHTSVDCIVVDPRNCTAVFLNTIIDINWYVVLIILHFSLDLWFSNLFDPHSSVFRSTKHDHVQDILCEVASHSNFWKDKT